MEQAFPVMLVIRNSRGEIRWMEVREYLRRETLARREHSEEKRRVSEIPFKGQRFDVMTVRRWREEALRSASETT